jgi:hypothetical protein
MWTAIKCLVGFVICGALLTVSAAVTSPAATWPVNPGADAYFFLSVDASTAVAGFNGQLNYDSTKFSNPRIETSGGSYGFIVAGNEIAPGQFRFVLYANPTQTVRTWAPLFLVTLKAASNLASGSSSVATFSLMAASDAAGVSLTNVTFGNITLKTVDTRNAASEWPLYD